MRDACDDKSSSVRSSVWCVFSLLNCIASITRQQRSTSQVSTAVQAGMAPLHLTLCRKSHAGLKMQQGSALTFAGISSMMCIVEV